MASRLIIFLVIALLGCRVCRAEDNRQPPAAKRLLMLYSERNELPAIRAIDSGLREALSTRGGVELFAEYLDFARFPAEHHSDGLLALLRDRYGERKLDMVVTTGYEALRFALSSRDVLFPGVPITYCGLEQHQLSGEVLPADVTGAVLHYDFRRTIELALKLQPDLQEVVCVGGSSQFDRHVGEDAMAALAAFPRLRVRKLDEMPYAAVMQEVGRLPATSMVLYTSMLRDSAGQTRFAPQVAGELSARSSVPVYGVAEHHLEKGLIGGAMMDYAAHGRDIGAALVSRLNGATEAFHEAPASPWLINWNALEKWRIPGGRVPEEAVLRFKPPSLWEKRRLMILTIIAVVVMQSALIGGLLVNRSTRLRAERALVESTERMNLAAKAANLGLWVWDVSGDDAWMTEQARSLFGFGKDTRVDYAVILDRVHPEDRAARAQAIQEALATQGEYEMEYRIMAPDGEVRWISARGRCIGSDHGRGQKLLGVSMDITARKEAEMEAVQQRNDLGHLWRVALMGEMATSLAHELNQPLTAIVSNASAAQRFLANGNMDPDELRDVLADISADGRRAGDVIRGIKGMVRKSEFKRSVIDGNELIGDVLRLVKADALANGCELVTHLEATPPLVAGDPVQLQQVLLNLIINSLDAMRKIPGDTCRVEVSLRQLDPGTVEFAVRDFGPGLPPDAALRVFDRFFSTKHEGMGMGLSIARSIVEAHGGTLAVENADGGGARFWFTMPIHQKTSIRREAHES